MGLKDEAEGKSTTDPRERSPGGRADGPVSPPLPREPDTSGAASHQQELAAPETAGAIPEEVIAEPFIGPRGRPRRGFESSLVRIVATCGVIGIAVALAAVLGTQDISAWVIGLVVSTLSVILAAILWSSRML